MLDCKRALKMLAEKFEPSADAVIADAQRRLGNKRFLDEAVGRMKAKKLYGR